MTRYESFTGGLQSPDNARFLVAPSDAQSGGDALVSPMPVVPPPLPGRSITSDAALVFDGEVLDVGLTANMLTEGGAPPVVVEEFEGQPPQTAFGSRSLMTATLTVICMGSRAQYVHDVLHARILAGQVFRVYAPMIGPATQGMVWAATKPPAVDPRPLKTSANILTRWNATIELLEWRPLKAATPAQGSRVSPGKARAKARIKSKLPRETSDDVFGRRFG